MAGPERAGRAAGPLGERVHYFGTPVDLLDLDATLAAVRQAMASRTRLRHTALNVAKLMRLGRDPELAQDVRESDLIGIDGVGIALGLGLFGVPDAPRVAGVDLMLAIFAMCAREGYRPYVLGARQDVLDEALRVARRRFAGLEFAGARNGYFGAEEEVGVVAAIRQSDADCLFVAMPTPRKERFLHRHAEALEVPFIMGVGGSIDVLAGTVSRAPLWMQRAGLEWLHRLIQEPRKMFWRYVSTNSEYAWLLVRTKLRGRNPVNRAVPREPIPRRTAGR